MNDPKTEVIFPRSHPTFFGKNFDMLQFVRRVAVMAPTPSGMVRVGTAMGEHTYESITIEIEWDPQYAGFFDLIADWTTNIVWSRSEGYTGLVLGGVNLTANEKKPYFETGGEQDFGYLPAPKFCEFTGQHGHTVRVEETAEGFAFYMNGGSMGGTWVWGPE